MRLICPNCGAQYEVADDVIPQDGRDVQCCNCAHTWFENHGASEAEDTPAQNVDPALDDMEDDDAAWGAEDYAAKPEIAEKTAPKRQELDPAIADILREEAAREAAARRAEAEIEMQSQPDLGLDTADAAPDQRSVEAQRRMALLKGDETVNAPVMAPSAGSRSELLPDTLFWSRVEMATPLRSTCNAVAVVPGTLSRTSRNVTRHRCRNPLRSLLSRSCPSKPHSRIS